MGHGPSAFSVRETKSVTSGSQKVSSNHTLPPNDGAVLNECFVVFDTLPFLALSRGYEDFPFTMGFPSQDHLYGCKFKKFVVSVRNSNALKSGPNEQIRDQRYLES